MEMMRYRGPQGGASIGLGGVFYRTDEDGCIEAPADAVDQLRAHGFTPWKDEDEVAAPAGMITVEPVHDPVFLESDGLSRLKRMGLFKVLRHARIPFEMTMSNDELRAKCREHGLRAAGREA